MHKSALLSGILHSALLSIIVIGLSATVRPAAQQLVFGIEIAPNGVEDGSDAAVSSPVGAPAARGEEVGFTLGFSRTAEPPAEADVGADGGLIPPSSGAPAAAGPATRQGPRPGRRRR